MSKPRLSRRLKKQAMFARPRQSLLTEFLIGSKPVARKMAKVNREAWQTWKGRSKHER